MRVGSLEVEGEIAPNDTALGENFSPSAVCIRIGSLEPVGRDPEAPSGSVRLGPGTQYVGRTEYGSAFQNPYSAP